jgi:hypothetical protein
VADGYWRCIYICGAVVVLHVVPIFKQAMGEAQKGFAPLAPDGYGPGSPEWNQKTELTDTAELQFYAGLA